MKLGSPDEVRAVLWKWYRAKAPAMVEFREVLDPVYDPVARYVVAYEAHFEPASLDQSRVEVDVSTEGEIGIGFELEERVARRLGFVSKSQRVVSGHEPCGRSTREALLAILDSIAGGEIHVSATVLPLLGLIGTSAVVPQNTARALKSKGYGDIQQKWYFVRRQWTQYMPMTRLLRYKAWN